MEPDVAVCFAVWLLAMFADAVICLRFLTPGRKKGDGSRRILGQGEKKILLCALLGMVMTARFVFVHPYAFNPAGPDIGEDQERRRLCNRQ